MEHSTDQHNFAQAICFLYKDEDDKNKCILSKEVLTIIYRSRKYLFDIEQIQQIEFETRKLMFPLIFGAITAAFTALSLVNNLFNLWISLSVLIISLVVTYFGWSGTNVLTIKEKGNQNDFMLKHISINMKSFVNYCNKYIKFRRGQLSEKDLMIYHITSARAWKKAIEHGRYIHESLQKEGFIHASDVHQVLSTARAYYRNEKDLVLLVIHPEKLSSPVKYELAPNRNELFPHIYGSINPEAVVDVKPLQKDGSGNYVFPSVIINQNS